MMPCAENKSKKRMVQPQPQPQPLTDLPPEMRAEISRWLSVSDRARLNAALPRAARVHPVNAAAERTLGVLAMAVRRRRVSALSSKMRDFLSTVLKHDPTLSELAEVFPEVRDIVYQPGTRCLLELRKAKALTQNDVARVLALTTEGMRDFLAGCTPDFFRLMHAEAPDAVQSALNKGGFVFKVVNALNEELLTHLPEFYDGSLQATMNPWDLPILCAGASSRAIVFRHFTITDEQVRKLYDAAVGKLDVDGMLIYEARLRADS